MIRPKRAKLLLHKGAKFVRPLFGGGTNLHPTTQTSVKFRDLTWQSYILSWLVFKKSFLNWAILLIWRRFFQKCWGIFPVKTMEGSQYCCWLVLYCYQERINSFSLILTHREWLIVGTQLYYFEINKTPLKELLCFSKDIEIILNLTGCLLTIQDSDSVYILSFQVSA